MPCVREPEVFALFLSNFEWQRQRWWWWRWRIFLLLFVVVEKNDAKEKDWEQNYYFDVCVFIWARQRDVQLLYVYILYWPEWSPSIYFFGVIHYYAAFTGAINRSREQNTIIRHFAIISFMSEMYINVSNQTNSTATATNENGSNWNGRVDNLNGEKKEYSSRIMRTFRVALGECEFGPAIVVRTKDVFRWLVFADGPTKSACQMLKPLFHRCRLLTFAAAATDCF